MTDEDKNLAQAFPDSFLTFQLIKGNLFGFEARSLWEISTSTVSSPLPRSSTRLVGITHLHGKIIPVVDLCSLLELPYLEQSSSKGFIAVKPPGWDAPAGFYAENILGFEKFKEMEIEPPLPGEADYLKGRAGSKDRMIRILDMDRLFAGVKQALPAGNRMDHSLTIKGENYV